MRIVLDASVAVAAARALEPHHAWARATVDRVLAGDDEISVPAIFGIEVVAGLVRRGHHAAAAARFVETLLVAPAEVVTIGPRRAVRIAALAATYRLRAADACYAWVAARQRAPLATLDQELARRALGVHVRAP